MDAFKPKNVVEKHKSKKMKIVLLDVMIIENIY